MKLLFLFLFLSAEIVLAQQSSRFTVARSVVAGGGSTFSSSSRFQLASTIAQPAASVPSNSRFTVQSGFWYRPGLEVVAAAKVGTNFVFSFETEPGKAYSVQYADSLVNSGWQVFANFTGEGVAKTVTQSTVGVTNRFYRIIQH